MCSASFKSSTMDIHGVKNLDYIGFRLVNNKKNKKHPAFKIETDIFEFLLKLTHACNYINN